MRNKNVLTAEEIDEGRRWDRGMELGQRLCRAVQGKKYKKAKEILFQALEWESGEMVANSIYDRRDHECSEMSPLVIACYYQDAEMVKLLLSFPGIIAQDEHCKFDPVKEASHDDSAEVLWLLLRDHRIKANRYVYRGDSPLRYSFQNPQDIRWLIASRKPLVKDEYDDVLVAFHEAEERKKHSSNPEIPLAMELLKSYHDDPVGTTKRIRIELGLDVSDAAEVYALVVLLCDGFFTLSDATLSPAARFLGMVSKMPMELQMMTCHRAFESSRDLVRRQDSELVFKRLGEILALEDGWKAPSYDKDNDNVDPVHTYRGGFKVMRND